MGGLIGKADKDALTPEVADEGANVFRRALSIGYYGWLDDDFFIATQRINLFGCNKRSLHKCHDP